MKRMHPSPPARLPEHADAMPDVELQDVQLEEKPGPDGAFMAYWKRIGGGSFAVSLLLHAVFVLVAVFFVFFSSKGPDKPEDVDFLSGGGGGTDGNTHINKHRQRMMVTRTPAAKISSAATSSILLPDTTSTISSLSTLSVTSGMMSGARGTGGGFGGGKGTGTGTGTGSGFGPGQGGGFVAMFGKSLKARKLGVVLDISKSMHPYLATVVREANKVGSGAPVVCYYGCGLMTPKQRLREKAQPTEGKDFDHFWHRMPNGPKPDEDTDVDTRKPLPLQDIYDVLHKRKDTFYYEKQGVGNAWLALTAPELRDVDAIYWFADFQDGVDAEKLKDVVKEFERRKQKLYIHASGNRARSLQTILDEIVKPTGGEEIKVDLKPAPANNGGPPKKKQKK